MAKGIKKIKWAGAGEIYEKLSYKDTKITIKPDQFVWFTVSEWYPGSTPEDKVKKVTWIWQEQDRKKVITKKVADADGEYGIKLPKRLCGPYTFYLEASLSGKQDSKVTGLYIGGYTAPRVTSTKWAATKGGADARKTLFSYGVPVYLSIDTEGLNGNKNLGILIYRKVSGGSGAKDDVLIASYNGAQAVKGVVNLEIKNTLSWHAKMKGIKDTEEFYIKVKDIATNAFILDANKDAIHARFLRIKNKIVQPAPPPPTNKTPLKVGSTTVNHSKPIPCKYETITVVDKDSTKSKLTTILYDPKKNKNIKAYHTLAGASSGRKKSLDFTFEKISNKGCFNTGKPNAHKKEVEIFLNGVKQKTEVLKTDTLKLDVLANANIALLQARPEFYFLMPDAVNKYKLAVKTCNQPSGVVNINVHPNVERELAFVLTLFKSFSAEVNQKFSYREKLTDYNKKQSMKLIRDELEILYNTKGGLGYGLSAKMKVDDVESSMELGATKSQIKKLIGFYNTVKEVTSVFDGKDKVSTSIAYSKSVYPKVTLDIDPPNVALALRMTNRKIQKSVQIVRQFSGAIALKPITKIKIGVDLLTLVQYMGVGGKIADWIKERLEKRYKFTMYVIFEVSLEAKGEISLTYNKIDGFASGARKLQLEAAVAIKGGVKSTEFVTVFVPEAGGTQQKVNVEKFKGEATGTSSLLYTYEINADVKGQYSEHKLEFTGVKATIIIYVIRDGMTYNQSYKKEFTLIEKPAKPWFQSDREYVI